MPRTARLQAGFTLIELLTVIAIIAILAAASMAVFARVMEKAKVGRAEADMRNLRTALEAYRVDWDTYPPEELDVLRGKDLDWNGATTGQTPADLRYSYLRRLELGTQKETAFFDIFTDPPQPYVYIGVYSRNVDKVREFLDQHNAQGDLETYCLNPRLLEAVRGELRDRHRLYLPPDRPAPRFDQWVMMSIGPTDPEQGCGGLKPDLSDLNLDDPSDEEQAEIRMRRLTAYMLATLDKNGNDYLDYDYESRKNKYDGRRDDGTTEPLPNGSVSSLGPIITMGP